MGLGRIQTIALFIFPFIEEHFLQSRACLLIKNETIERGYREEDQQFFRNVAPLMEQCAVTLQVERHERN